MLYRAKIELIDEEGIRVSMNDFFASNINKKGFPIASVSYPLLGSNKIGSFERLEVNMNVWCMLEKDDCRLPVIIGIIKESQDFPTVNSNTILKIQNSKYGIEISYDTNDNIKIIMDGDIEISTTSGHKNLLTQLNDIKDSIIEIESNITKMNTSFDSHTHGVISVGSSTTPPIPLITPLIQWLMNSFNIIFKKK